MLERLVEIVNKKASAITEEDKEYVIWASGLLEKPFTPSGRCLNCYIDQAVVLVTALRGNEDVEASDSAYVLRDGLDVTFGLIRVNSATINDELAEKLIAKGFALKFFKKIPSNEG